MTTIIMILGIVLGVVVGIALPTIPYTASKFLAIAIVAALDSVLGGAASRINKKFNAGVFVSGFFINAILAILLTYLGERLNVDIYLATIIVFVGRIFNNLGIIRRHYITLVSDKMSKHKKKTKTETETEEIKEESKEDSEEDEVKE